MRQDGMHALRFTLGVCFLNSAESAPPFLSSSSRPSSRNVHLHTHTHQTPMVLNNDIGEIALHTPLPSVDNVPDWEGVKAAVLYEFDAYPSHDDGSIAPAVLRLGWHSAGTYDPDNMPRGGTCGATMRFDPEASYNENKGLAVAREAMFKVKLLHPLVSMSDLWVFASYLAIEHLGGPAIEFVPGRPDAITGGPEHCPPEERLPAFDDPAAALRDKFNRMGLDDRDLVALMGGHTVGRTHPENSDFPYMTWDRTKLVFDNVYYEFLLENWWVYDDFDPENPFYFNRSWIMLLSDWVLRNDERFRPLVEVYAADEDLWFKDFASAFKRITELGLPDAKVGLKQVAEPPPQQKAA